MDGSQKLSRTFDVQTDTPYPRPCIPLTPPDSTAIQMTRQNRVAIIRWLKAKATIDAMLSLDGLVISLPGGPRKVFVGDWVVLQKQQDNTVRCVYFTNEAFTTVYRPKRTVRR